MDEAIEVVRKYAAAERAAIAASYLEADEAAFRSKLAAAQAHLWKAPGGTLELSLGRMDGAGDTEENRGFADSVEERRILMVKRYEHPELGKLYAVYVTPEDEQFVLGYGEILYVAQKDGELRIVSRYRKGMPGGSQSWEWMGGERIDDPGQPVETRKLLAPEHPADRADYDAA